MILLVYWFFGYIACVYVNRHKTYIYRPGALFMHQMGMGLMLGWFYIPFAILKMIFGRK